MACEDKCFTFMWKIENADYWSQKNTWIYSPDFVVDSIDKTKWCLGISPWGEKGSENFVGFCLFRDPFSNGDHKVSVKYELAFLSKDAFVRTYLHSDTCDFPKNKGRGTLRFAKREDVFIRKRFAFLPQDMLRARCRMWKCDGEIAEDVRWFARTRIAVKKRAFLWKMENFSNLKCGRKYAYETKSLGFSKQLMSVNLCFTEKLSSKGAIYFQVNIQDQDIKYSTLVLSVIDISGNKKECNREDFWSDDASKTKEFKFFFTKNELMAMKSLYLPNDILSMHWQWAFSKGTLSHEIEAVQYASTSCENETFNAENGHNQCMTPLSYPLNENLKSLCDEKFLCDVELKTSTRTFNAHKLLLSASSPVFKAMFSSDMKEKYTSSVNIEDLSDDTIGRMLAYIYTARIEDLTWERSSLSYAAADKYAISNLKHICSSYLQENLSPTNACEVLLLSEFHADDDLKSSVQYYMFKHLKDIVNSEGWKNVMENYSSLAAEFLSLPYN